MLSSIETALAQWRIAQMDSVRKMDTIVLEVCSTLAQGSERRVSLESTWEEVKKEMVEMKREWQKDLHAGAKALQENESLKKQLERPPVKKDVYINNPGEQ